MADANDFAGWLEKPIRPCWIWGSFVFDNESAVRNTLPLRAQRRTTALDALPIVERAARGIKDVRTKVPDRGGLLRSGASVKTGAGAGGQVHAGLGSPGGRACKPRRGCERGRPRSMDTGTSSRGRGQWAFPLRFQRDPTTGVQVPLNDPDVCGGERMNRFALQWLLPDQCERLTRDPAGRGSRRPTYWLSATASTKRTLCSTCAGRSIRRTRCQRR